MRATPSGSGRRKSTKKRRATQSQTPVTGWRIEQPEYDARVERVRGELDRRELDGLVLFHPIRMAYLTGFFHLSTERPMAVVVGRKGELGALIPLLEQEHVAKSPGVRRVKVYPEYPTGGTKHPLLHLADLLTAMKLNKSGTRLGYDSDGYLDINGYDGPNLSEIVDAGVATVRARDVVDRLRYVKSAAEVRLIRESCTWGNLAHSLMHQSLALGRSEPDISNLASAEASQIMSAALGPTYQMLSKGWGPAAQVAFSAGQATSLPHGLANSAGLQYGDVLVTYAGADVGGYQSELERTMFLGVPGKELAASFAMMLDLQQAGFDALRPGRTLAEAEAEVAAVYTELEVKEQQRHHTGHGIGLEGHEGPFIDLGDETVIAEGMVFSVEPGLYVPGLAGFRHSDTVVIGANGAERLTYYPRDLVSLTVNLL